jgi:hypothetical protein
MGGCSMSADKILHAFGRDWSHQTLDQSNTDFGKTAGSWSDTLKYTDGVTDFTHRVGSATGGSEDIIDVNNKACDVTVVAKELWSGGKYVATIKGGSTATYLEGTIYKGGSEVDIDYGNHSDQSSAKTTGNILNVKHKSGAPVTVRVLNADKPLFTPGSGPYVYVFPHPDAWYHGICVRFFMVFHKFFK